MPRARPKPSAPDYDLGTGTAAATMNTVIRPVPADANGRKRRQRMSSLELLLKNGDITPRQFIAGETISDAFAETIRSPAAIQEIQVDTPPSRGPDHASSIDRRREYLRLMGMVPKRSKAIVTVICALNGDTSALYRGGPREDRLALLTEGLDAVAEGIGGGRR